MKDFLQNNIYGKINEILEPLIEKYFDPVIEFIQELSPSVLACILLILVICLLVGLLVWLFKGFKSFLIIIIIIAIFGGLAVLANGGFTEASTQILSLLL